jgi:hypothetical protein
LPFSLLFSLVLRKKDWEKPSREKNENNTKKFIDERKSQAMKQAKEREKLKKVIIIFKEKFIFVLEKHFLVDLSLNHSFVKILYAGYEKTVETRTCNSPTQQLTFNAKARIPSNSVTLLTC